MEGRGTKGNTFVGTGCILRNTSAGHWNPLLWLANCNHQKAEVNKQVFLFLFEQNQITSHEKVNEKNKEKEKNDLYESRLRGKNRREDEDCVIYKKTKY